MTKHRNLQVLYIIEVFARHTRAKAIPDESAKSIARTLMKKWVSVAGPMKANVLDKEPNLVADGAKILADMLEAGRMKGYTFP